MKTVYLSLGSNMGDREQFLAQARRRLAEAGVEIRRASSIYETEPMDLKDQRAFLNQALEAQTELFPMQLLGRVQKIEIALGRRRIVAKGPRTLDIDILLIGGVVIDSLRLQVPHPRMHERRFVLEPLVELSPDLRHPITRRTMRDLLSDVLTQHVRKLTPATSL
ncbi:MAG: 2-amino-4-hydroxy-6-hydroxymethyldihydropteridine diphosphokinase [Bryobacteraceae bacterium]